MHVGLKKRVEINNRGAPNEENGDVKNFQKLISMIPRTYIRNLRVLNFLPK